MHQHRKRQEGLQEVRSSEFICKLRKKHLPEMTGKTVVAVVITAEHPEININANQAMSHTIVIVVVISR